jgi:hypothetical protein
MKPVALGILALSMFAATASAQIGSGAPNCDRDYQAFLTRFSSGPAKDLSGAQLAQVNRYALRAYDGCTSGDERSAAESIFKRLESINPAKADEFFRDLERSFAAKR